MAQLKVGKSNYHLMASEHMFGNDSQETLESSEEIKHSVTQRPLSLFYIWFAANLTIGDFAIGFIPIEFGQPVFPTVIALVIGNVTGGALLGIMSVMGVLTRKPQMSLSQGPFGKLGSSAMAFLQWGNTLGWLTVNLVLASFALEIIMKGVYFVIPLLVVALIVLVLAYYGHEAIRKFELVMSVALGVLFFAISVQTILDFSSGITYSLTPTIPVYAGFGITLAASFSYIMAWGPYASDYSRFVGGKKEKSRSFSYAFLGGAIASFWIEMLGMGVAIASGEPNANPASALANYMGQYFIAGMIALFLGGIAANALNLYSNGLALNTAFRRTGRKLPIFLGTAVGIILGVVGYHRFYEFYEYFLFILDYWITPWLGILIAHYFWLRPRFGTDRKMSRKYSGSIAYAASILISVPFMYPPKYFAGPIGTLLNGVDVSYYVSFFLAILFYLLLNRSTAASRKRNIAPTD